MAEENSSITKVQESVKDLHTRQIRLSQRRLILAAGAGLIASALGGAWSGARYNDAQLRPQYNDAVASYQRVVAESAKLQQRISELEQRLKDADRMSGEIEGKDKIISEYETLFEKYFGKPPEQKTEESK